MLWARWHRPRRSIRWAAKSCAAGITHAESASISRCFEACGSFALARADAHAKRRIQFPTNRHNCAIFLLARRLPYLIKSSRTPHRDAPAKCTVEDDSRGFGQWRHGWRTIKLPSPPLMDEDAKTGRLLVGPFSFIRDACACICLRKDTRLPECRMPERHPLHCGTQTRCPMRRDLRQGPISANGSVYAVERRVYVQLG